MVSKALVVGEYQRKLEEIAAVPGIELTVVVPPSWRQEGGVELRLERLHTRGYELVVLPLRFNGNFHLFHFIGLDGVIRRRRPHVLHVDEEPYNLATVLALRAGRRVGARCCFFAWQNLLRHYPPPFRLFERYCYRESAAAIAGNQDAAAVLRAKGYAGPLAVIPQFGVDPDRFSPAPQRPANACLRIGFAGRLVEEKGVRVLLAACARLRGEWRLQLVGDGPLREAVRAEAVALGLGERVELLGSQPSAAMPGLLRSWDVLALPSLTRPNWKEQFGRALVEAMACGLAVAGSNSGEIPNVIGEAGLVVPEGDAEALAAALQRLLDDPGLRRELGRRGRERVLARFTQARVAAETVALYRQMLAETPATPASASQER